MVRPQTLKVAVAGLGGIGKRHAISLLSLVPGVELVAAFSTAPVELQWAKEHLEPLGVLLYDEYEQMMYHPSLQAVIIATTPSAHKSEILRAMDMDLHVMCEKPLSPDLASCYEILEAAQAKSYLKIMCAFSQRSNARYREAWNRVQQGLIGTPTFIRSEICDKYDASGFTPNYSATSGSIFADMALPDIDLSLWFFGDDIRPKSVTAHRLAALQPELLRTNERYSAVGIVEYHGGRLAYIYASQTITQGREDATEVIGVIGTEGKLSVKIQPKADLESLSCPGSLTQDTQDCPQRRLEHVFRSEICEFVECCISGSVLLMPLDTAVKASEIASALQESLVLGKTVRFGQGGKRVMAARL